VGGPRFSYIAKGAVQPWGELRGFKWTNSHGVTEVHGAHPCKHDESSGSALEALFGPRGVEWARALSQAGVRGPHSFRTLGPVSRLPR
jgi:hypothetical protein